MNENPSITIHRESIDHDWGMCKALLEFTSGREVEIAMECIASNHGRVLEFADLTIEIPSAVRE